MRLFTGKGDTGQTDLLGDRVAKDDPRIEVLGALDETTSAMGLGRAMAVDGRTHASLLEAQRDLYKIMAELAFTDALRPAEYTLGPDRVGWLESTTDAISADVPLPKAFIVPGGSVAGAALDVARTIARRAEREVVAVHHAGHAVNPEVLRYLNRLSSLLFMLARAEDRLAGAAPTPAKISSRSGADR